MRDLCIYLLGYFMGIIATVSLGNAWVHYPLIVVQSGLFYWFLFAGRDRITK